MITIFVYYDWVFLMMKSWIDNIFLSDKRSPGKQKIKIRYN